MIAQYVVLPCFDSLRLIVEKLEMLHFLLVASLSLRCCVTAVRYTPDWKSLDSRPLPQWYDDAKVGVFFHWGVWAAPSFGTGTATESSFLWRNWRNNVTDVVHYIRQNYPPDFTYADFAASFRAEFFNPDQWADILKSARVKCVTSIFIDHDVLYMSC